MVFFVPRKQDATPQELVEKRPLYARAAIRDFCPPKSITRMDGFAVLLFLKGPFIPYNIALRIFRAVPRTQSWPFAFEFNAASWLLWLVI
jgi:hypothetical protein